MNISSGTFKGIAFVFAMFVFLVIFLLALFGTNGFGLMPTPLQTTELKNVFVDINGDGKLDFIANANVILNSNPSFP